MYRNQMIFFERGHLNKNVYYLMNSLTRVNFLFTVTLSVWMMHILIHSVYTMQNVYIMKHYYQKRTFK